MVAEERPLAPALGTIALRIVMRTKAKADIDGGAIDPDPDLARVGVATRHSDHLVTCPHLGIRHMDIIHHHQVIQEDHLLDTGRHHPMDGCLHPAIRHHPMGSCRRRQRATITRHLAMPGWRPRGLLVPRLLLETGRRSHRLDGMANLIQRRLRGKGRKRTCRNSPMLTQTHLLAILQLRQAVSPSKATARPSHPARRLHPSQARLGSR